MDLINEEQNSVQAINSHEIFHYQPKRKIDIINENNNLSPYDKNFTYIVSFHPISPYVFYSDNTNHSVVDGDYVCPDGFIDKEDIHYQNLDSLDQQKDSNSTFYPIFSIDNTCNYDYTSLEECEFYDCFTAFIYKGVIHQVINDATSQPALVHLTIDISDIPKLKNSQYHLILTRNDNVYVMHLVNNLDSIFSKYDLELLNSVDRRAYNTSLNNNNNNVYPTTYGDVTIIDLNKEYVMNFDGNNTNGYVTFELTEATQQVVIEYIPDITHTITGISKETSDIGYYYYTKDEEGYNYNNYDSIDTIDYIYNSVADEYINADIYDKNSVTFNSLEPGVYRLYVGSYNNYQSYQDYTKIAFKRYVDSDDGAFPKKQTIKIITTNYDSYIYDQNKNYITTYTSVDNNINVSECTNDSTLSIGYLERQPRNSNIDKFVYKNSFKGYISEFTYYRDQSYFRKFENLISQNAFEQTISYDSTNNHLIYPDYISDIPSQDSGIYFNKKIINYNKIPCRTVFNLNSRRWNLEGSLSEYETDNDSVEYGDIIVPGTCYNDYGDSYECDTTESGPISSFPQIKPYKETFINPYINNIILINENIIDSTTAYKTNKIVHMEFPNVVDSTSGAVYHGNDLTTSDTPTLCIFTFDIMKNIGDTTAHEIYDQVKFLMRGDFVLELYNENKTYESYIIDDIFINYIKPEHFIDSTTNNTKNNILMSLNEYITEIKNNVENLAITKFVINCFRDSRYMFLYNIQHRGTELNNFNGTPSDIIKIPSITKHKNEAMFDSFFNSPQGASLSHRLNNPYDTSYFRVGVINDSTNINDIYINGFNYSNFSYESSSTMDLFYSLNLYDDQLNTLSTAFILNGLLPLEQEVLFVEKDISIPITTNRPVMTEYIVTPSAGPHGTISPSTPVTVLLGTTTFTIIPDSGYIAIVGGTCGGTLVGNIYTTNEIVQNCTVEVTFIEDTIIPPDTTTDATDTTSSIFNNLQIINKFGDIYREMPAYQYTSNILNTSILDTIYNYDSTTIGIVYDIVQDINKFQYINLNSTSSPHTYIVNEIDLLCNSKEVLNFDHTITQIDSTSYFIEYDNSKLTEKTQLLINFDFTTIESFEWALFKKVDIEYNGYTHDNSRIYPSIKVNNMSIYETELLANHKTYALKPYQTKQQSIYVAFAVGYTLSLYDSLMYNKPDTEYMSEVDNINIKYNIYTNNIYKYIKNIISPITVTYEGNKRVIIN